MAPLVFCVCLLLSLSLTSAQMPNSTDLVLTVLSVTPALIPGASMDINGTAYHHSLTVGNQMNEPIKVIVNGEVIWPAIQPGDYSPFRSVVLAYAANNNFSALLPNGTDVSLVKAFGLGGSASFINFSIPNYYKTSESMNYDLLFTNIATNRTYLSSCYGNYGANGPPMYKAILSDINNAAQLFPAGECTMSMVITTMDNELVSTIPFPTTLFFQPYLNNASVVEFNSVWDGVNMTIQGGFLPSYSYACNFNFQFPGNESSMVNVSSSFQALDSLTQFTCTIPNGTWNIVKQAVGFLPSVLQKAPNGDVSPVLTATRNSLRFWYKQEPQPTSAPPPPPPPPTHGPSKKTVIIIVSVVCSVGGVGLVVAAVLVYRLSKRRKYNELSMPVNRVESR